VTKLPESLVRFRSELEDAIRAHPGMTEEPADGLPSSVVRFEPQLQEAIDRKRRRRRTSGRLTALTTVAAVTIAIVMVGGLLGGGSSASAIELTQATLSGSDGEILHVVTSTTLTGPHGATEISRAEQWQQNTPPYDERNLGFASDGTRGRELATAQGRPQYYDPLTNTIHTTAPDAAVPAANGLDGEITGRGLVDRMRTFLKSGDAHEDGHLTIDGRDAIRIVAEDLTLIVDANTYQPIEWRTSVSGTGGRYDSSTTRIETYEWLPATPANMALTSLTTQHADAKIITDATISGTTAPKGT
jgi:hypothetical protein